MTDRKQVKDSKTDGASEEPRSDQAQRASERIDSLEDLSQNERLVLWGITCHPSLNDRNLARQVGLKLSTVTAIRNRLKKAGAYSSVRIPLMAGVGCELFCISYYRLTFARPPEEVSKALKEAIDEVKPVFFAVADKFQLLTFAFCRDYSEAHAASEQIRETLASMDILNARSVSNIRAFYPLKSAKLLNLFDFSKIMRRRFGLGGGESQPELPPEKDVLPRVLSKIERKVYAALVQNAGIVDNAVAGRIGVTRQSVTKIRKRLEADKLLVNVKIPDLNLMGSEIMAFAHYKLAPGSPFQRRRKALGWVMKEIPNFFHITTDQDGVMMGLARNFSEAQDFLYSVLKLYFNEGFFIEEPSVTMFSVKDLQVLRGFQFLPIMKSMLALDEK
jgi:DNA-binding MarR family transcriptional regulator